MKLTSAEQKSVVLNLFIVDQNGQKVERKIQLEDMPEAIALKKKLIEGQVEIKNDADVLVGYNLSSDEIELTDVEIKLAKKWFEEVKEWTVELGEYALEVKELFNS